MTADQRRIAALYDQYGPVIFRRAVKLLRDRESAKDATQEVFLKLVREFSGDSPPKAVLGWIYRTTTHHCLNVLRETKRRSRRDFEFAQSSRNPVSEPEQEQVSQKWLAASLLANCDAETREVAVAVLVDGMPHEEVAAALDISRKTVGRRLARFLEGARAQTEGT